MSDKIDIIFDEIKKDFMKWVIKKPSGSYSFHIYVNCGGIRGHPEINKKEKIGDR